MDFRHNGKMALSQMLKNEKNISIIEKTIYNHTGDNEDEYKRIVYQVISDIMGKMSIKKIYRNIKQGNIGWKHHSYQLLRTIIKEQNDFIENPFEVEEGIHTCKKCGSKRVFSYNRQVRGGDEGTGVFCECFACHVKWHEKG